MLFSTANGHVAHGMPPPSGSWRAKSLTVHFIDLFSISVSRLYITTIAGVGRHSQSRSQHKQTAIQKNPENRRSETTLRQSESRALTHPAHPAHPAYPAYPAYHVSRFNISTGSTWPIVRTPLTQTPHTGGPLDCVQCHNHRAHICIRRLWPSLC